MNGGNSYDGMSVAWLMRKETGDQLAWQARTQRRR
jgi:hypothetical protein